MEAIIRKRRCLKGKLTRIESATLHVNNAPLAPYLASKYNEQLSILWTELNTYNEEICALCDDATFDEQQAEFNLLANRIEALQVIVAAVNVPILNNPAEATTSSSVNLPKLDLPTFNGNLYEWSSYFDLFSATINNNSSLSGAQKLQYLKASLRGDAAYLLQSVQVTNANFDEAWAILVKRYQNKREIVNSHLHRLCSQKQLHSESPGELRRLIDTTVETVRTLRVLNVPVDQWDAILVHLVAERVDADTRRHWELSMTTNEIPKFDDFISFLEQRARALLTCAPQRNKGPFIANKTFSSDRKDHTAAHHTSTSYEFCGICDNKHASFKCPVLQEKSAEERRTLVKAKQLCFNCLSKDHIVKNCKSGSCKKCAGRHHTLLHYKHEMPPQESSSSPKVVTHFSGNQKTNNYSHVLLATALIKVEDKFGNDQICRALIDSGSQATFISESCAQRLGLKRSYKNVTVSGLGLTKVENTRGASTVKITSCLDPSFKLTVEALILKSISGVLPSQHCRPEKWDHIKTLKLADPSFGSPAPVDILLGADVYAEAMLEGRRCGIRGAPVAMESVFGWLLSGRLDSEGQSTTIATHFVNLDLEQSVQRFWDLEEVPSASPFTDEEKSCEEHFASTFQRNQQGRFIVQLPFKTTDVEVVGTRDIAIQRLKQVERKLEHVPERKRAYHDFMKEYLELNHMEAVPQDEIRSATAVYFPHHAVLREQSTTTKLRVVFDASARGRNGTSLNEHLKVGPTIQDDLFTILIRFRKHLIALNADITKMYRQIEVDKQDTDYQRIVWRDCPTNPIRDYRLLTVTYGTASAPYLAIKCLQQLAKDEAKDFPQAAKVIQNDFYVDDLLSGTETEEEAILLQSQLQEVLRRGGFELTKWSSNSSELLKTNCEGQSPIQIADNEAVKTLGLRWNPSSDYFSFKVDQSSSKAINTKRSVLSDMSRTFDPLGWLSPVTVKNKILFQQLWKSSCDWDDQLPVEIDREWTNHQQTLKTIEDIEIRRTLFSKGTVSHQLHGFCDASERAYAAAIYLRSIQEDGKSEIVLVAAKTKVAPIKLVSLPRLELCGALLLARLFDAVQRALQLPVQETFAWTDSTIVLAWISAAPSRWKTFVANRVVAIQELVPASQWHHINGVENPADCASRGISPIELNMHPLWWQGPAWLKDLRQIPEPKHVNTLDNETAKEERIVTFKCAVGERFTLIDKYSSLTTLTRTTAYLQRFIHNCRSKSSEGRTGFITKDETDAALLFWIKRAQHDEFEAEIDCLKAKQPLPSKSRLPSLAPFLDPNGVLRVGGRLRHANVHVDKKFPILLPAKHALTVLIVRQEHLRSLHGGPQLLLATLQQRFWIIRGRDLVRQHVRQCVTCCRERGQIQQQAMGDLPKARVIQTRPFNICGVDYAGPFTLRAMKVRGKTTYKAYIALFVCFVTRAIHLELVSDQSTDSFIAALKRFVARRGNCSEIHSDCGTNFVGANTELKLFLKLTRNQVHNAKVAQHLGEAGIKWNFNPPAAPHFGGLWEAGVKSVKFHFRRIVGNVTLNFEEMSTILAQIEASLNSRPLCALSNTPDDLAALTPGHFLIGDALNAIPEPDFTDHKINRLSRWQLTQKMFQHFWKRWSGEYLSRLQQRPKGWTKVSEVKINDLILLKDERLPPLHWRLGRILRLHPGADGIVRVVDVKTATGECRRPMSKICKLPIDQD